MGAAVRAQDGRRHVSAHGSPALRAAHAASRWATSPHQRHRARVFVLGKEQPAASIAHRAACHEQVAHSAAAGERARARRVPIGKGLLRWRRASDIDLAYSGGGVARCSIRTTARCRWGTCKAGDTCCPCRSWRPSCTKSGPPVGVRADGISTHHTVARCLYLIFS